VKLETLNNKMMRMFSSIDGHFIDIRLMADRLSRLQDEQPWEIS